MAYTPAIDKTFKANWMVCELLIQTGDIQKSFKYSEETFPLIENLVKEFTMEFSETGIYFTDEAQDGQDFEGIRTNNKKKIWQFDYAVIPISLESIYMPNSKIHKIKRHNLFFEAWYINKWKTK